MRLSITVVEAYRLFLAGEWMPLEDLLSTIRKDSPENENMRRGRAFHAILEHPEDCRRGDDFICADLAFAAEGIDRVLKLIPPGRVAEVKATYELDGITLSGVADALYGLDVDEYKCTGRIDVERYFESFQWRAYLVMFNAARVRYVLAQYKDGMPIEITNVLPLTMYRYPAVLDDVKRMANECADFIVKQGLEAYCVSGEQLRQKAA